MIALLETNLTPSIYDSEIFDTNIFLRIGAIDLKIIVHVSSVGEY